ncbi:MAG: hypothetical protein GY820_02790 [Gammaproteobacteria bacterium]|nr:hypothetical protein [Gammaproteobacteria bacterium]
MRFLIKYAVYSGKMKIMRFIAENSKLCVSHGLHLNPAPEYNRCIKGGGGMADFFWDIDFKL